MLGRPDDEIGAFAFGDGGRLVLATFSDRAAEFSAADGTLRSSVPGSFGRGDISSNGARGRATDGRRRRRRGHRHGRPCNPPDRHRHLARQRPFGPTADVIVARDAAGDVHVVRCEICASTTSCWRLRTLGWRWCSRGSKRSARRSSPPPSAAGGRLHRLLRLGSGGPRSPASPASRTASQSGCSPSAMSPTTRPTRPRSSTPRSRSAPTASSASSRSPGRAGRMQSHRGSASTAAPEAPENARPLRRAAGDG